MQDKNIIINNIPDNPLKRIGEKLSCLMVQHGLDTQELSNRTGLGTATINNLRRGTGNPTISTLSALADFFHVSIGSFTDAEVLNEPNPPGKVKTLPLIRYSEIEAFIADVFVPTMTYSAEVDNVKDTSLLAIEIMNNALSPELERGTICIISRNEPFTDGDIVLIKIKEYPACFRRIFIGNNGFYFCNISIGSELDMIEYDEYEIIGVLLKKINRMK